MLLHEYKIIVIGNRWIIQNTPKCSASTRIAYLQTTGDCGLIEGRTTNDSFHNPSRNGRPEDVSQQTK